MSRILLAAAFAAVCITSATAQEGNASAKGGFFDLIFSEYIEGEEFNRALEIYNPTNSTINLGDYAVEVLGGGPLNKGSRSGRKGGGFYPLPSVDLDPGEIWVIVDSDADLPGLQTGDQFEELEFNGFGGVALVFNGGEVPKGGGGVVDQIGPGDLFPVNKGGPPEPEEGFGLCGTNMKDRTLRRRPDNCENRDFPHANPEELLEDFYGLEATATGDLGSYTPDCGFPPVDAEAPALLGTNPTDGAVDVDPNGSITLSFDEPVFSFCGEIRLYLDEDDSLVETFVIWRDTVINGNSLIFTPTAPLSPNTAYYVEVDGEGAIPERKGIVLPASVVQDPYGNLFAGGAPFFFAFTTGTGGDGGDPPIPVELSEFEVDSDG